MRNLALVALLFLVASCVKQPDPWKPDGAARSDDLLLGDHRRGDVGAEDLEEPPDDVGDAVSDLPSADLADSVGEVEADLPPVEVADLPADAPESDLFETVEPLDAEADLADSAGEVGADLPPEVVCDDLCEADAAQCSEAGVPQLCVAGESGCLEWVDQGTCDDGNPCTEDFCDVPTGVCKTETASLDGTSCDADGDGCTANDACADGTCLAGVPVSCSDLDALCQVGSCVSLGAQEHVCEAKPAPASTPCEDGDFCTIGEVCDGEGGCQGGIPNSCGLVPDPCQVVSCNPFTEKCKLEAAPNGDSCDDEEPCTVDDECLDGQCVGGPDLCLPRVVSTTTSLAGAIGLAGPPSVIDLGGGRTLVLWRSGDDRVSGRFLDGELSLSYPETHFVDGWVPGPDGCDNVLESVTAASRANGDWVLAMAWKVARVWRWDGNMRCSAAFDYHVTYAAFDRDGQVLQAPQAIGEASELWYDTYKSSGGQIADYECACAKYPSAFPPYLDISFPSPKSVAGGGLTVVAFPDDSFAVVSWDAGSDNGTFHPINALLEAKPGTNVFGAQQLSACVLSGSGEAFLVYRDSEGGAQGVLYENESGASLAAPFPVTNAVAGELDTPTCVGLPGDDAAVTVSHCDVLLGCDIGLQVVEPAAATAGEEVAVHPPDDGAQTVARRPLSMGSLGFGLLWSDDPFGGLPSRVRLRRYQNSGDPAGAAKALSPEETAPHYWPEGLWTGAGIVAAWAREQSGLRKVVFRAVDDGGLPLTGSRERRVARTTVGDQARGAGVELPDGDYVVVWESENLPGGLGRDIALRRFAPDGTPVGEETRVNETTLGDQVEPGVACDPETGTLLVTWTHPGGDGSTDIRGRLVPLDGSPMGDELAISPATQNPEAEYRSTPVRLADGRWVVTYTGWTSQGYLEDIFMGLFDGSGQSLLPPEKQRVNYTRGQRQDHASTVALPGTSAFVTASARYAESGWKPLHVSVRRLDVGQDNSLSGTPPANDIVLAETGEPEDPAIVTNGNLLLVCWKSGSAVPCQALTPDLQFVGGTFNVEWAGAPARVALANLGTDGVAVSYEQTGSDEEGLGIVLARRGYDGTVLEPSVLANWTGADDQGGPFVVPLSLAELLVVGWTSQGQDGSGAGVYQRVLE
jgi:hypothetical protein